MSYFYNLLVATKAITVTRQYQLFDIFAAAAFFFPIWQICERTIAPKRVQSEAAVSAYDVGI